jgi:hypothetical protein
MMPSSTAGPDASKVPVSPRKTIAETIVTLRGDEAAAGTTETTRATINARVSEILIAILHFAYEGMPFNSLRQPSLFPY